MLFFELGMPTEATAVLLRLFVDFSSINPCISSGSLRFLDTFLPTRSGLLVAYGRRRQYKLQTKLSSSSLQAETGRFLSIARTEIPWPHGLFSTPPVSSRN